MSKAKGGKNKMEVTIFEKYLRDSNKILLEPLKQWYCDSCGEIINSADVGWLEWLKNYRTDEESNFRIVHHTHECMYDSRDMHRRGYMTKDMHLDYYIGPDGLNRLLDIMLRPEVNREEVAKIIRRLHVPFYEQSLLYRPIAFEEGYFINDPDLYCSVRDNLELINKYANSY